MIIGVGGVIYRDTPPYDILDVREADAIARANGLAYAEDFCRIYDGQMLKIDDSTLRIVMQDATEDIEFAMTHALERR